MPRKCSICFHDERLRIDEALIGGSSIRDVAARFRATASSIGRHKNKCVPKSLMRAQNAREIAHGDTLMEQVEIQRDNCLRLLRKAEDADDLKTAVAAAREVRGHLELLGRVSGELAANDRPAVNIDIGAVLSQLEAMTMRDVTPERKPRDLAGRETVLVERSSRHPK